MKKKTLFTVAVTAALLGSRAFAGDTSVSYTHLTLPTRVAV